MPKPVYIAATKRTPIGSYLGALSTIAAPRLGARAIMATLEQAGVEPAAVQEVFMGNVLSAGIGQAPARQASRYAGLPDDVPCTTVNKVCGSGLQAVILAAKTIAVGDAELVVAGGMESMSNVPYYLTQGRTGYRMGDGSLKDGMILDGLWDPYSDQHMGNCGELCAAEYGLSREAQDAYATESYRRASAAQQEGLFADELCSVEVPARRGDPLVVDTDEEPARGKPEKFARLRPAFSREGTVTAANASSLNDGACALLLASEAAVKQHGLTPLGRIEGYAGAAQAPEWFTTAPAKAIDNALTRTGLTKNDIGLHEINEAFSVVPMAVAKLCDLDLARVNVRGGAVSIGHPIGASGARILTTLLYAMRDLEVARGMASICIGGGEALAVVVHRG
ncbi:MAG: acetyl-CoA C-acyltransferase [Myxococcota bacterium]